jgi:hypothetical protein
LPRGKPFIEGMIVDSYENKDYYEEYMIAALLRLDSRKIDFIIKNNNDQNMRNIKILLKINKEAKLWRDIDFPNLPSSSLLTASVVTLRAPIYNNQSLFHSREYGNYVTLEYTKENLYPDEEFILDEPLYVPLFTDDIIKIEYTIFSENLSNIKGDLEIKIEKEDKVLSPMDTFKRI